MIDLSLLDLFALGAVILIGLPHGAFDGAVFALLPQKSLSGTSGQKSLALFLGVYLLMTGAVIAFWLMMPLLCLILFLALSTYHFGKGDTEGFHGGARLIAIIAHGGLVTLFLPLIHQQDALSYFAALTFRTEAEMANMVPLLAIGGALWLASVLAYGWMSYVNPYYRSRFAEVLLLAALMAYLPLIPAFALYFCAIHSRRHFIGLYHATRTLAPQKLVPLGLCLSFASWGAGAVMLFILNQHQSFAISAIQIIFIGLAALTVPHMLLVDGLWRPLTRNNMAANRGRADVR